MTTIACDGRSMAGDGREIECNTITGNAVSKVRRLDDGRIVGIAGNVTDGNAFVRWLSEGGQKPKLPNFKALVLSPDGSLTWYDAKLEGLNSEAPAAIGSGMDHALTAMDAGCSPERAVELAALRDPGTGGKITVIHLQPRAVEAA